MKKLFFITLSLCTLSFAFYINFPELIEQRLSNYYQNNYPEKIYIQTDKPFYALGDDLWFSGYLVNGITHQKTEKSRIIYVELISPKDSLVASRTLYVDDISVAGDFKINENWDSGTYLLRGYTNYMNNQSSKYFFQKEIYIYNITKDLLVLKDSIPKENINKKILEPTLSFYPEGGYLVNNIPNRVAFKIKNIANNHFKAFLKDQSGKEITELKSLEYGLGIFTIKPETGKNYYVTTNINGKEYQFPLPKSLEKGYTLNVTNSTNNITINATSTTQQGLNNTYLVGHQRGKLLFKKHEESNNNSYLVSIPAKSIGDGILNITLFNNDGQPVAERAVFINNPQNKTGLSIKTDQTTYTSRKKVTINLKVANAIGENESSTLSMSVRDLNAYPHNTRNSNIKTYLLLNSDLRGRIEDPNYFFEKENDYKRKYMLDLVMMTNGWKRFTWQELLQSKETEQKNSPEKGIFISGTIKKLKKPYTAQQGPVRLTFLGTFFDQQPIKMSDSLGNFKFGPYNFYDTIPSLLESRLDRFYSANPKSRDVVIMLNKHKDIPKITKETTNYKNKNSLKKKENFVKVTKYIQQVKFEYHQQIQELKAVELKVKKETKQDNRSTEMNNRTNYGAVGLGGSKRLDINDITGASSYSALQLLSWLSGVYITHDEVFLTRTQSQPKILLDGMEIDTDFLSSINGEDISFIDLLVGPDASFVTIGGGNGVIAVYTKLGYEGTKNIKRKPGVINFDAIGFYTAREFYTPEHVNNFELTNKEDIRTTLYWNPKIKTNTETVTEISFFTSDLKSDYIIEIEGISDNGDPIHQIKTFIVE